MFSFILGFIAGLIFRKLLLRSILKLFKTVWEWFVGEMRYVWPDFGKPEKPKKKKK